MQNSNLSLNLLKKMVKIRTAEELVADDYLKNKIFSFLHLSVGQESAAVGVCSALVDEDLVMGNHRSHHHYLAKGGNLEKMIFEIYGDSRGCCKGYGGSMHMLDRSVGFVGSTPILGSVAPLGTGIGFYLKVSNRKNIAVIFIGDGAAEEGAMYESVNLAGLFNIPILFVIEDNKFSVASPHTDRKSSSYSYENIFSGLGAIYSRIKADNVINVYNETNRLKELMLLEKKPAVLHLDVTRGVFGHSGPLKEVKDGQAASYRSNETLEYLYENDCIKSLIDSLINEGFSKSELDELVEDQKNEVETIFSKIRSQIKIRI